MLPSNRLAYFLTSAPEPALPRKRQAPKTQLGTYVTEELYDALTDFAEASGIPITRIVEDALRGYLARNYWKVGDDA